MAGCSPIRYNWLVTCTKKEKYGFSRFKSSTRPRSLIAVHLNSENVLKKVRSGFKWDRFANEMICYITKKEESNRLQIQHQAEKFEVGDNLIL